MSGTAYRMAYYTLTMFCCKQMKASRRDAARAIAFALNRQVYHFIALAPGPYRG
jgi:hypothetical protein